MRTLLNLLAVLKPYWKCLQHLNDQEESMGLNKYLDEWDKTYRQNVKFYSNENPPETFDLTGFYPLYSDDENLILDKEIDLLIEKTDLFVPEQRTCVCGDESSISLFNKLNLSKCVQITPPVGAENFLLTISEEIFNRKVNSIIEILFQEFLMKLLLFYLVYEWICVSSN